MRSYPHPLPRLPALAPHLSGPERRWPGAEELAAKLVTLPTHSRLAPGDLSAIVHLLAPALPNAPPSAVRPVPSLR
jgi:dTDP-4-amino-4,6-dideoxygalactose transaminase